MNAKVGEISKYQYQLGLAITKMVKKWSSDERATSKKAATKDIWQEKDV